MAKKSLFWLASFVLLVGLVFVGTNEGFAEEHDQEDDQDILVEDPAEVEKEKQVKGMKIAKFELEIELMDKTEMEWEYEKKRKKAKAEIEHGDKKIKGKKAVKEMESIIAKLKVTKDMEEDAIVAHVLEVVGVNAKDVKKLELEMECDKGNKISIKK
ncbi:YusW family protein [Evansella sp. AB-rgal1]|uniref:YusW family protein n=1 Tax=Evansella sp. AB-rgal1 TaxID=3242696 RepID=UPI00359DC97C